jgi:ribosomal protein S18 acetylase RimI-like enzyme
MNRSKCIVIISTIFFALSSNRILASAFHSSSFRFLTFPLRSLSRDFVYIRNAINDESEDHVIAEKESTCGYSILLADSREKVLGIKSYRFGGPNVEEHMESNPDLISRQDALQSLTSTFDDRGIQKVFYGNGDTGESVQFYALADSVSPFLSTVEQEYENAKVSLLETHGVLGSIEAVKENTRKGDCLKQVSIELKNLSVHANARRRGIGKALTEAVQEYARHQISILEQQENQRYTGIVHLLVESDNKGAMKLYKETGFVLNDPVVKNQLCKLTWSTEGKDSSR